MGLHCFFSFELSYQREPRSPTGTGLPRSAVRSHKKLLQAPHSLCRMVGCPLEIPRLAITADRAEIGRITPFYGQMSSRSRELRTNQLALGGRCDLRSTAMAGWLAADGPICIGAGRFSVDRL